MANVSDWGPSSTTAAETGTLKPRPSLSLVDLVLHLWRSKWLMLLIFIPIFLGGVAIAFMLPETFTTTSRVLVRDGVERKTDPTSTEVGGPKLEEIVQGEIELLKSPSIIERLMRRFPVEDILPEHAEATALKIEKTPEDEISIRAKSDREALIQVSKLLEVWTVPRSPVVTAEFEHKDPIIAANALNTIMDEYLVYRAEIYGSRGTDEISLQRQRTETDLLDAEDAIRAFLRINGIGDFASERATAQSLFAGVSTSLLTARSRASAIEGQLTTTRSQLTGMEPNVDFFVEDSTDQTLIELQIERERLLGRFTEDSRAVQNIDKQIEQVRALISGQQGPKGTTRSGPNPTYQAAQDRLNSLEAEAQSVSGQIEELERQLQQIDGKLKQFSSLAPEWNELNRNRDLLDRGVRSLADRERQETNVANLTREGVNSVRILERAPIPVEGTSLKLPVAAASFLFAGFSALMAGLISVFTRKGFATPASLERTVGLKVLGVVKRR